MRPDARASAAIEVLDRWLSGAGPAERLLADWGRANRYAGSGDRRAIADLVYDALRRQRSAGWVAGAGDGRGLILGGLLLEGTDPGAVFTGARHAPPPLAEREGEAGADLAEAPWAVRHDLPDWLEPHLGHLPPATLDAMTRRAPLDLRVNRLKSTPDEARARLSAEGIDTAPAELDRDALRVLSGAHRVLRSDAYRDGLVEIQDAASQAVARFAAARPTETVLDLCAGGGGKTLALAAAIENRGRLIAHDIDPRRLAPLEERARRAGAKVELWPDRDLSRLGGSADLVLVDAPCSGSGTWRRNPEAKWAFDPPSLEAMTRAQDQVLDRAVPLLAPGGRIVYATCSLIRAENAARLEAFLARNPGFRIEAERELADHALGDGFFAATLSLG